MDKYGVLTYNLNVKTPPLMKYQFIVLIFLFSLQVTVFLSIPFLFYHPSQYTCYSDSTGEPYACTEEHICQQKYKIKYTLSAAENLRSVSTDFNLICSEGKAIETAIISFMWMSQAFGFCLSMIYDVKKSAKSKWMLFTVLLQSAVLGLLKILGPQLDLWATTMILCGWNFLFGFYFSQQYAYINDVYSQVINNCGPIVLGFFQTLFGLFYILYAYMYCGNWKQQLVSFTAIPIAFFGILWFFIYDYQDDEEERNKVAKSFFYQIKKNNFLQELLCKYHELLTYPKLLTNFIMYILSWQISSLAVNNSILVWGDLKDFIEVDFTKNILYSQVLDLIVAIIAWYLYTHFPTRNIMFVNSIVCGFLLVGALGVTQNNNFYLLFFTIFVAKAFKSILIDGLLIVIGALLPYRYLVFLFAFSNALSLFLASFIPLYKVTMDSLGINSFAPFGIMAFVCAYYIRAWNYKEDLGIEEVCQEGIRPIRGAGKKQSNENITPLIQQ